MVVAGGYRRMARIISLYTHTQKQGDQGNNKRKSAVPTAASFCWNPVEY